MSNTATKSSRVAAIQVAVLALVLALSVLSCAALAVTPHVKWTYTGRSNLYGPPIVADVAPSPGKEIIFSDAEARAIRCVSAHGRLLWTYRGGWKKRQVGVPSLSFHAVPGHAMLIVGNGDGSLHCIDARDGSRFWARKLGFIEWGDAIWADIQGNRRDAIVAGTRDDGIVALDAAGRIIWRYRGEPGWKPIRINGPIAAADIDGNGRSAIFACTSLGPICVGADGKLRWARLTGDGYQGAPLLADLDHSGRPQLYCTSADENAVWSIDARTGAVRWRYPMLAPADVYDSSSMAAGSVNGGEDEQLVVSDQAGHVYCLGPDGDLRWLFSTEERVSGAVTLGDVDGDGEVETLVASADRSLYCLDSRGELKWRYAADRRLVYPATIADVEGDGKADILLCACARKLRCLTLDARYDPRLMPWPSRRFDAAQSGSCINRRNPASLRRITETQSLITSGAGGFDYPAPAGGSDAYPRGSSISGDRARRPRGWHIAYHASARWALDTTTYRTGPAALRVDGGENTVAITGDPFSVSASLRGVSAGIYCRGASGTALIRWTGNQGVVREDPLTTEKESPDGWRLLSAAKLIPPRQARFGTLVLLSGPPQGASTWWDDAWITGAFLRRVRLQVLVNQVGYDVGAPKRFTVQTNLPGLTGSFALLAPDGRRLFVGALQPMGRIVGAYGSDWGSSYLRGDFSAIDRPGRYRLRVDVDGAPETSCSFEIAKDLLWRRTVRRAYRLFYYQRCGTAVPGYHGPCHLDDAANLTYTRWYNLSGGWHEAGDYNPNETEKNVYGLLQAYTAQRRRFDALDAAYPSATRLTAEIPWGADQVRRMILPDGSAPGPLTIGCSYMGPPELETDNIPRTGDERPVLMDDGQDPSTHVAALAKCARWVLRGDPRYIEAAERGMKWCIRHRVTTPEAFAAALDLFVLTGKPGYAAEAKSLFPKVGLDDPDAAEQFDTLFRDNHTADLRKRFVKEADEILRRAGNNPFGVFRYGPTTHPSFFLPPPPGGTEAEDGGGSVGGSNTDLLPAAITVARAYRYQPDPRYLAFVYDQFNWILGTNPFGLCMLEGAGTFNPPRYHQAMTFAGIERGAMPGGIPNGITWRGVADDRPQFDMRLIDIPESRTNEIWLPHNRRYIILISELMRCRHGR